MPEARTGARLDLLDLLGDHLGEGRIMEDGVAFAKRIDVIGRLGSQEGL